VLDYCVLVHRVVLRDVFVPLVRTHSYLLRWIFRVYVELGKPRPETPLRGIGSIVAA